MTTDHISKEGRPRNGTTFFDTDSLRVTQQHDSEPDDRYVADERWTGNLARMARRAADDTAFYEIAGGTVQRLADEIRIQRIADERYDGGEAA